MYPLGPRCVGRRGSGTNNLRCQHLVFVFALGVALLVASSAAAPSRALAAETSYVGPTDILFMDADTVFLLRSKEWNSAAVRQQEKLLLHSIRMRYWRAHLPSDMRRVFDAIGYPI